jgi:hypothetical protein
MVFEKVKPRFFIVSKRLESKDDTFISCQIMKLGAYAAKIDFKNKRASLYFL